MREMFFLRKIDAFHENVTTIFPQSLMTVIKILQSFASGNLMFFSKASLPQDSMIFMKIRNWFLFPKFFVFMKIRHQVFLPELDVVFFFILNMSFFSKVWNPTRSFNSRILMLYIEIRLIFFFSRFFFQKLKVFQKKKLTLTFNLYTAQFWCKFDTKFYSRCIT